MRRAYSGRLISFGRRVSAPARKSPLTVGLADVNPMFAEILPALSDIQLSTPLNGAMRDIHRLPTDVFSTSFDEISAEQAKLAFLRLNSLKACAKLLGLKQRRMSGRCRRSCDNSASGTPAATLLLPHFRHWFFMPLSSSVPRALRQAPTILVDADALANGMRDLNARIADVNVRTGATALLEVHSRLLFQTVRARVRRLPSGVSR